MTDASVIRILVDSANPQTRDFLAARLEESRFAVVNASPPEKFVEVARRQHPQIAVIDRVHEGHELAEMKIDILKEVCPGVRIIAVSEDPSDRDAEIVERGVFYYHSAPIGPELVRVIEAAARAITSHAAGQR
ncbi:MAG: hypothetical protein ACYS0F_14230 [Planctomycetota bacterium]|jgi:DNA-binding response OmpR family regulator